MNTKYIYTEPSENSKYVIIENISDNIDLVYGLIKEDE